MKMTKSIQKASDGMVLAKVKGSNDPHYIKVEDLKIDGITLKEVVNQANEAFDELDKYNDKNDLKVKEQDKLIKGLTDEVKSLKNELEQFKALFKDTIDEWVKL